ncbi:hypothetical protein QEN19_003545 [Hanseniaspora menglaensis]
MHFRNLNLYKKATTKPSYYTSNTSYGNYGCKGSSVSSAASALASLSIGAATGTFVLKNVQKKCLSELEEQQKIYQDHEISKEDLKTNFSSNTELSQKVASEGNITSLGRKRRTKFRSSSFTARKRRGSFDGFSSNILKVDKNIMVNGKSPAYGFKIDVFNNSNKYFSQERTSNDNSSHQEAKKQSQTDNKVCFSTEAHHIKYAAAVQLLKNTNQIDNQITKEKNDFAFSNQSMSENYLKDDNDINFRHVRRISLNGDSKNVIKMSKSSSMQTQVSFNLNEKNSSALNKRLANKKLVNIKGNDLLTAQVDNQIKLIENMKLDDWLQDKDIAVSQEIYENNKKIWPADTDNGFNTLSFTDSLTKQIDSAFLQKDYNKIYSLYLAMKRNECIPSVETFDKIIKSLCLRDMDNENLDERMFNILTCYQDLIGLKIKPLASTYHDIILALFEGSLLAVEMNNSNGKDFYKIALDFFKTTYASLLKNHLSSHLIEALLYSSLKYQTNLNSQYIYSILPELMMSYSTISMQEYQYLMIKFSFDFQSLQQTVLSSINKQTGTVDLSVEKLKESVLLTSAVTTGLLKLNNLQLASKILNAAMTFFKVNENILLNQNHIKQELLETYLLQLSQINLNKAEQLRLAFETKSNEKNAFIPKLSFNFYKTYLYNSMCWLPQQSQISVDLMGVCKNIFRRLFSMSVNDSANAYIFSKKKWDMLVHTSNNVSPSNISYEQLMNQIFNYFLHSSEQDLETITMILEDSVMKNYKFSGEQYFKIFEFLINDIQASDEYILRFVTSHGMLNLKDLQFLNTIVSALESNNKNNLIVKLSKTKYFVLLASRFDLQKMNDFEFKGLTRVFQSIWATKQDISMIAIDLGLHSYILNEVHNLENLYNKIEQTLEVQDFFKQLEENFCERYMNFKKFNLDETKLDNQVKELAVKVLGL